MKRCVAEFTERYVNIGADRLELDREENMIYAWNGAELVGAFDVRGEKTMMPKKKKKIQRYICRPTVELPGQTMQRQCGRPLPHDAC